MMRGTRLSSHLCGEGEERGREEKREGGRRREKEVRGEEGEVWGGVGEEEEVWGGEGEERERRERCGEVRERKEGERER